MSAFPSTGRQAAFI